MISLAVVMLCHNWRFDHTFMLRFAITTLSFDQSIGGIAISTSAWPLGYLQSLVQCGR